MSTLRRNSKREIRRRIFEIMKAANKGLLIVPLSAIPVGMSMREFAESWTKQGGGKIIYLDTTTKEVEYFPDHTLERLKKSGCITMSELRNIKTRFGIQ